MNIPDFSRNLLKAAMFCFVLKILAVEVATNGASILCEEEGWEEEDGPGLPIFE